MKKLAGRRRRRTRNEGDEMKRGRERRDRHGIRILNHSRPPAAPLSLFLPFSQRISPPQMVFSPYYSLFLALSRVGNECPCPRRSTPIVGRIPKSLFVGLCIRRPDSLGEGRSRASRSQYPCPVPYTYSQFVRGALSEHHVLCGINILSFIRRRRCRRRSNSLTQVLVNLA